jgi:hypothetical protein
MADHAVTPDGRYFVVRGRLWRMAKPDLPDQEREALVKALMSARRAVRSARAGGDETAEACAHAAVDHRAGLKACRAAARGWCAATLGENRGPPSNSDVLSVLTDPNRIGASIDRRAPP